MTDQTTTQPDLSPSALAGGRYEVLRPLNRGGQARTFLVRDRHTGGEQVIKELDLSDAADWKGVELFERESHVLRSLSHPGIPRYLDAFSREDERGAHFFLVQEYIPGESLREVIERGEVFDEAQARELVQNVLDILGYLESMSPPVVHRDIKPANLVRRPDGAVCLVDFGAVQELTQATVGGETVVGTTGFAPPEQLMGKAVPASDLYALGATVVYLMSGVHPSDVPMRHMRLQWEDLIAVTPDFGTLLNRLLAPDVDDRVQDAAQARAWLDHGHTSDDEGSQNLPAAASDHALVNRDDIVIDPLAIVERQAILGELFGGPELAPPGYVAKLDAAIEAIPSRLAHRWRKKKQVRVELPGIDDSQRPKPALAITLQWPESGLLAVRWPDRLMMHFGSRQPLMLVGFFVLHMLVFTAVFTALVNFKFAAGLVFALALGIGVLFYPRMVGTELDFQARRFSITRRLFGLSWHHEGETMDLGEAVVVKDNLRLREGVLEHKITESTNPRQLEYMKDAINDFLSDTRP